ncbi:acyl-CoA dehydrogenase family protein [Salicibibacter cibarius]|uniref:Acyl-CoA dehydrogenase family protein n=2 Tax=Salicibibacter cibarius TaxID=2743000 RepID=A0A7T7CBX5_9BACI|nr:acyl-CoA dehydrogenase family protein [Salicibibacter cibarius]QQK76409.1 acyl-CoA dehydrogenase family protein [Salicibibacter cibarius]
MVKELELPIVDLPKETESLREDVRDFISTELHNESFTTRSDSWLSGFSADFSRKLGERGWLGMTWPKKYGGHERTAFERFVVTEELLAAGAPVAAHWFADRQTGPLLLKYGNEYQRQTFLPKISRGELFFAVGLSEPNSGSDLASISTRAKKLGNKWVMNGSKIWSSGAHHAHYIVVLLRTSTQGEKKHDGISQMIVDLSAPGVTVRPIYLMTGEHHFNEVIFEDVEVSEDMIVGEVGGGWKQSMAELAYERSGPERFLSTYPLLKELINQLSETSGKHANIKVGKLASRLWTLRCMSLGVAGLLEKGDSPDIAASLVKDMGTQFEKDVIDVARELIPSRPSMNAPTKFETLLAESILHAPGFTLRGGTTEILRSIIARGIGV